MKMRAVPEGFDNAQALHSPYGSTQGIGDPIASPIAYQHLPHQPTLRPLVVDTMQRHDVPEHMSPSGVSPAFNQVNFAASLGTNAMISPLSSSASDRYYPSQNTSPISVRPRSANPFLRQGSTDSYNSHSHQSQGRPLPLPLTQTMSRNRSDSLQSPLRSSMSWVGDEYQAMARSGLSNRQQSTYQPGEVRSLPPSGHHYDAQSSLTGTDITSNAIVDRRPNSDAGSHHSFAAMTRIRASSSAFPAQLQLNTAHQYRTVPSQQPATAGFTPSIPRSSSFSGAFGSGGFQSAPLDPPGDFHLPRTPGDVPSRDYGLPRDYTTAQMSAPMTQPAEFTGYDLGAVPREHRYQGRTSLRDQHSQQQQQHAHQQQQQEQQQQQRHRTSSNYEGSRAEGPEHSGQPRGYTVPGAYGSP